MKKSFLILALMSIITVSCKKEKIDMHPEFIGLWEAETASATYELNVKSNGKMYS